jgi:hypothetical protein
MGYRELKRFISGKLWEKEKLFFPGMGLPNKIFQANRTIDAIVSAPWSYFVSGVPCKDLRRNKKALSGLDAKTQLTFPSGIKRPGFNTG